MITISTTGRVLIHDQLFGLTHAGLVLLAPRRGAPTCLSAVCVRRSSRMSVNRTVRLRGYTCVDGVRVIREAETPGSRKTHG
ncbi:hypothetical protein DEV91_12953 [Phyllobacterium brassicacearum]|nr:hypothetical protein DEV91_12953 [Phyllobacterium brassicacearum]